MEPETGDIYYLNGNVGIGTNNPEYLLDISGDINLTVIYFKMESYFLEAVVEEVE